MTDKPLTVAQTPVFERQAEKVWSDEERDEFIDYISMNPDIGEIIPETGGVRKVRWGRQGTGKRGGVRVIYFYYDIATPLYLLMVYGKAERENMTTDELKAARAFTATLKQKHRN